MTLTDLPILPKIEIPPLPFEVPLLMHPAIVHFAIAIPILVLILELFNLIFKRRVLNIISSLLLLTLSVIYLALYVTGKTDGSEAFALFSDEAKSAFKAHVQVGTYLVYTSILLIVFKVLALLFRKPFFKVLYLLIIIGFIAVNLQQGKGGGELVYIHGANVNAVIEASSDNDDLTEEVEELTEELDSLKEEVAALKEAKEKLTCKEVQESIDVIMQEDEKAKEVETPVAEAPVVEAVEETAKDVEQAAQEATQEVQESAENVAQQAQEVAQEATKEVQESAQEVQEAVETVAQEANTTVAE